MFTSKPFVSDYLLYIFTKGCVRKSWGEKKWVSGHSLDEKDRTKGVQLGKLTLNGVRMDQGILHCKTPVYRSFIIGTHVT